MILDMIIGMMTKSHHIFLRVGIILAASFFWPMGAQLAAQETIIEADSFAINEKTGIGEARGQVRMQSYGTVLTSESLSFDRERDIITLPQTFEWQLADGEIITADKAVLDQQNDTADLTNIRIELAPQGSLSAAQAAKQGERFLLRDGRITSCKSCAQSNTQPLWQIRSASSQYDRAAQYVTHKHARFEVAGWPIFYLPYLAHVGPEVNKASGVLPPSFYSSSDFGAAIELPYFFNLAPNYDLTITPRLSAKQDPLIESDWRHLTHFGRYKLRLWGHQPRHNLATEDGDYDFRGGIIGDGNFQFGQWRAQFHLEDSTDDLFLRRYKFISNEVMDSSLVLSRAQKNSTLTLATYRYRATLGNETANTIDNVAPRIMYNYRLPESLWGGRVSINNDFTHIVRDAGLETTALNSNLDWRRNIISSNGLDWEFGNRTNLTAQLYHGALPIAEDTEDNAENKEQEILTANSAFVKLGYPLRRSIGNFDENIEPQMQLVWASNNARYQDITLYEAAKFDLSRAALFNLAAPRDEISRANYGLRYQLAHANSFLGEIFLGQSYNLTNRILPPSSDNSNNGYGDDASAIISEIILRYKKSELRQNLRIDEASGKILRQQANLVLKLDWVDLTADYRALESGQINDKRLEEAAVGLNFTIKNSWSAKLNIVEDIENDRRTGGEFILTYQNDCLRTKLTIERTAPIRQTDEADTTIRLGFNLLSFSGD